MILGTALFPLEEVGTVLRRPLAFKDVLNPSHTLWSPWIPSPWWSLYSGATAQTLSPSPRTLQFQMGGVFSSTFCCHLVFNPQKATAHLGPPPHKGPITVSQKVKQNLFYNASVSFETSPTIFLFVRYCCHLSCDFPNPTSFSCTPCHLFPMWI